MPEYGGGNRDKIDLLLDDELATYGKADGGLEERVLRRVTVLAAQRRRLRLVWAVALPLAACLILALFLPHLVQHTPITVARLPVKPQTPPAPPKIEPGVEPTQETVRHVHVSSPRTVQQTAHTLAFVAKPKLDVFPTPRPLSPQEQAFVHYVANIPTGERADLVASQNKLDEPIEITAIQIPPIQLPPVGSK